VLQWYYTISIRSSSSSSTRSKWVSCMTGLGREGTPATHRRLPVCRTDRVRIPSAWEDIRQRTSPKGKARGKRLRTTHSSHIAWTVWVAVAWTLNKWLLLAINWTNIFRFRGTIGKNIIPPGNRLKSNRYMHKGGCRRVASPSRICTEE